MKEQSGWQNVNQTSTEDLVQNGGLAVRIDKDSTLSEAQVVEIVKSGNEYTAVDAEVYPKNFDFRQLSEEQQIWCAVDEFIETDRNTDSNAMHNLKPNKLMDYFASLHYEEAYEAAKVLFVPQAELPLFTSQEDSGKFETIHVSMEDVASPDVALDISEPNYHGTGYVNLEVSLLEDYVISLSERALTKDREDGSPVTKEDFENGGYADVYLNIDAEDKKISVEVVLTTDSEKANYSNIALKPEEAKEIFDVINEYCKQELGHDVHDEIRELRKGAEREEPQKEKLPEPKRRDDYEPEL